MRTLTDGPGAEITFFFLLGKDNTGVGNAYGVVRYRGVNRTGASYGILVQRSEAILVLFYS